MKQSVSTPAVIGVLVVVVLIIGFFVWRANTPQIPATAASSTQNTPNFQKNATPQDLAKQYGYGNKTKR